MPKKNTSKTKNLPPKVWLPIVLGATILASCVIWFQGRQALPVDGKLLLFLNKNHLNEKVCIQIITSARNLKTGETRDFPTPCDVPSDWEVVK